MNPSVSVLVPTFNGAKFLPATLDSILSQTHAPAEVIVFDDGSTDDTREVVLRMGSRVKYHFAQNGGICRARNAAASLATSEYLTFCDHDDLWRSDKLAQQMELHRKNPNLHYSFTNFSIVTDDVWSDKTKFEDARGDFLLPAVPEGLGPFELQDSIYDKLLKFQPIWPSTIAISREMFRRLGGFREELGKNPSEDLEFTLRCVMTPPIGVVREAVVGVRKHQTNYSGDNYKTIRGQIEVLRFALDHHPINDGTRGLIEKEIEVRSVAAAYDAFRRSDFNEVISLTAMADPSLLDSKMRLKVWISRMPLPVAKLLAKSLIKQ
jgi:glycosyltransferase involved in cell wall biosynthesis